jgi:prepilin-type N-terminal cleavage/methylation domain-containing protein
MAARIRAWLAQEDGMTLPELLTVMSILAVVMAGILGVFVSGLHATTNMDEQFQAQQSARLALTSMRNDIGSACTAAIGVVPGTPTRPTGSMLTLGCINGDPTQTATWCADSATGSAPFKLYRQTGSTCAYNTGTSRATSLTSNVVFTAPTCPGSGVVVRPQVVVTLPVDTNPINTNNRYTLTDTITLRNAQAAAQC